MTKLSNYDIDVRNKYLDEARSVYFLNSIFCIYFYNGDAKLWGPPPKPEDISPLEVFGDYDQKEYDQAIDRCNKLINDGRKIGGLALDRALEDSKYQKRAGGLLPKQFRI